MFIVKKGVFEVTLQPIISDCEQPWFAPKLLTLGVGDYIDVNRVVKSFGMTLG